MPYLQILQQKLDAGIGQAAQQLSASYADIYPSSLAHSACQPENVRWVEPLTPDDGGTNVLHPNLAGTTAMANALKPVVQQLLAAPVTAPSSSAPSTTASPSGAPSASSSAASGAPSSAGSEPLAATGPTTPVQWTLLLGALLIAAGGATLLVTSGVGRKRRVRH